MVPEISLTPQVIERFRSRYGSRIAVLHSSLTMGQRTDEWRRIRDGGADIIIGTRSAVFAPVENLGLIVIDEEQERTYQSESSPRFRTAEVARVRCPVPWGTAAALLGYAVGGELSCRPHRALYPGPAH